MNYFAIEGVDCLGKSTQIALLKECFKDAKFVKEPGESALGSQLRELILRKKMSKKAQLFLFLADRAELFSQIDFKRQFIISDRSMISHLAYANESESEILLRMNLFATDGVMPNAIILFKGDEGLLRERLAKKEADLIESRGIEYFLQVQENYEKIIKKLKIPTLIIDANKSIDEIFIKIKEFINDLRD